MPWYSRLEIPETSGIGTNAPCAAARCRPGWSPGAVGRWSPVSDSEVRGDRLRLRLSVGCCPLLDFPGYFLFSIFHTRPARRGDEHFMTTLHDIIHDLNFMHNFMKNFACGAN